MLYDTDGDIGIVTMNRPERLNAISHELRTAVSDSLIRADDDEAVNVIICARRAGLFVSATTSTTTRRNEPRAGSMRLNGAIP